MRVVIPTTRPDSPPHRALRTEGVPHEEVVLRGLLDYSALLCNLWQEGEEFAVVEHDVVPFPGALADMEGCEADWCVRAYPFAPKTIRPAMGCIRFSGELVRAYPLIYTAWQGAAWNQLDGRIWPVLQEVAGKPHLHRPPVAHLKAA